MAGVYMEDVTARLLLLLLRGAALGRRLLSMVVRSCWNKARPSPAPEPPQPTGPGAPRHGPEPLPPRRDRRRSLSGSRERRRSRSVSRDRDRDRRRRSRERHRDRSPKRSRSPKRRRTPPRRPRSASRSPVRPSKSESRPPPKPVKKELTEEDLEGKTEEEIEMIKIMGFSEFDSTKGRKVEGSVNAYAINVSQKRKYRQYMNRKGGFNRPLDFVA